MRGLFQWLAVSRARRVGVAAALVAAVVAATVAVVVLFAWSAVSFRDGLAANRAAAPTPSAATATPGATPNADPALCGRVAGEFLAAFTNPDTSEEEWKKQTGALLDPRANAHLDTIDRSAIPKSGEPRRVSPTAQPGSCDVTARLKGDKRPVTMELETQADGSWKVTTWDWPPEDPTPTADPGVGK